MYDSAVEVPRTTKWRRSLEFNNRTVEEEVVDVRDGRFSSELFDLGNNTSPFKKQKVIGDCLPDMKNKNHPSNNCCPGKNTVSHTKDSDASSFNCMLIDCEGELHFSTYVPYLQL